MKIRAQRWGRPSLSDLLNIPDACQTARQKHVIMSSGIVVLLLMHTGSLRTERQELILGYIKFQDKRHTVKNNYLTLWLGPENWTTELGVPPVYCHWGLTFLMPISLDICGWKWEPWKGKRALLDERIEWVRLKLAADLFMQVCV